VISGYKESLFHRGINDRSCLEEIAALSEKKISIRDTDVWVETLLNKKDFTFDPMSPSARRLRDTNYLELRREVVDGLVEQGVISFETVPSMKKLNLEQERKLDFALTNSLYSKLNMTLYEASRKEVWSYLTARVFPDLALLRFSFLDKSERQTKSRFTGVERNVLRRLHHRIACVNGDFSLLDPLLEDNLVAIFERPSLTQDLEFVSILLESISLQILPKLPIGDLRQDAVRDFAKRVLRASSSTKLAYFDIEDVREELKSLALLTVSLFRNGTPNQ
jgi:hypothetical protein